MANDLLINCFSFDSEYNWGIKNQGKILFGMVFNGAKVGENYGGGTGIINEREINGGITFKGAVKHISAPQEGGYLISNHSVLNGGIRFQGEVAYSKNSYETSGEAFIKNTGTLKDGIVFDKVLNIALYDSVCY